MKKILNKYIIISLLLALSTAACAKHDGIQTGKGSWYGKKFHGRQTASGEKYNMYALTAAHKKLPFNTMVKVTNLSNNRSVIVRINDRGPYAKGRIIDLSYLGARKLGYINKGVAKLKVEVLYKQK
jgi:rare lipoprotein A